WLNGAEESWQDAEALLGKRRWALGAFAVHLAVEKVLKAHVTRATGDIPPKTHNLRYLAELAKIQLTPDQVKLLVHLNEYQVDARYRDIDSPVPEPAIVQADMRSAKELSAWLKQLF